jgi:hypothetical protein
MNKHAHVRACVLLSAAPAAARTGMPARPAENGRLLTAGTGGHGFTNAHAWSPDGEWIVYDRRPVLADHDSRRIEQVKYISGETVLLYESDDDADCLLAYYHPIKPFVVFVHGPSHPAPDWGYAYTRRRGAIVDVANPGKIRPLDAMNYAPPFTPGALRGGSHVHIFSPDGQWLSFTYEDEVLARLAGSPLPHDENQRNLAISVPSGPVRVNRNHPRSHDGDWFSVVVTRTTNQPRPGSDEISRACEESWIGKNGYLRAGGTRQPRALAFQGRVTAPGGGAHAEVFVLDLPDDLARPDGAPLEGTPTRRPATPRGVAQRRLTFTAGRTHPGVAQDPRHWLHSSPDGSQIAFLMKDDAGIVQLWTVSPNGGAPRQVSAHPWGIDSAFTWSPDGNHIAHVMDSSVFVTEVATGRPIRLTARDPQTPPMRETCIFSPDGKNIAFLKHLPEGARHFPKIFLVPFTAPPPT